MAKLLNSSVDPISSKTANTDISVRDYLCDKRYRRMTVIACFIQVFNIINGINCIIFYSNLLFIDEGTGDGLARILSLGLGIWKLITTFAGIPFIDRSGRRPLLLIGCMGMAISEAALGAAIFYQTSLGV